MKQINGWITAPQGFVAAGVKAGIKKSGNYDVGIIASLVPAAAGAVFTQNVMASPAVVFSREVAKQDYARAIVFNAGCANACTGGQGMADAKRMAQLSEELLGAGKNQVYVCSTGVIGHLLPMDKVEQGIRESYKDLAVGGGEAATLAIQTTDTFVKKSAYEFKLNGKKAVIAGIAKGAGMIHPNMATMFSFITTDAAVQPAFLKKLVKEVADKSFNMVVVDGDTSTNDSMIVLANGLAGNPAIDSEQHPDYAIFYEALLAVSQDLAKLIARDGEGATKFLTVEVNEAENDTDAKVVAMAIAKSPLVKTAFFGQDPNWGRIVCAAGYSGASFSPDKVSVALNGQIIFENGLGTVPDLEKLKGVMSEHDITITVKLGAAEGKATVWTSDFSYDYVKINAEYHT